ncbi:hypothetical protein SDC9_200304 [bioreactor metagenome]|uniref:Uncharacterized protein n=1 Tax=bioreactor metagenome TaxID=1076179 RepID=A0A645IP57_9ZZZZ
MEYKKNGTTNTAALVLRVNPEDTQYKFSESRKRVIEGAKFKEFDKEIKDYMKTLKSDFDKSVQKQCTPKKLEKDSQAS